MLVVITQEFLSNDLLIANQVFEKLIAGGDPCHLSL